MKEYIWIVVLCLVMTVFSGCGSNPETDENENLSGTQTETEIETELESETESETQNNNFDMINSSIEEVYQRFCDIEMDMTLEQVEKTFKAELNFPETKDDTDIYWLWPEEGGSCVVRFVFSNNKLIEKHHEGLYPYDEYFEISKDIYESILLGATYDQVVSATGSVGALESETYSKELVKKHYIWFVTNVGQSNFNFENDILTEKTLGGQR